MFEQQGEGEFRGSLSDWVLRAGIALAFVLFGMDKFPSGPGAPWVAFFAQVGIGQWFRYATGVVEICGALLLLLPATVNTGLILLACTMAGAGVIHVFVIRHPFNSIVPLAFFCGLLAVLRRRRDH
jgi:uncharacterized membrane protein YphA (DoxX/SURF4 family)